MDLLDKINAEIKKIPGIPQCQVVPHISLSSDCLKQEKIFLIDDSPGVFEIYIPPIMSVTDAKASFLCHDHTVEVKDILDQVRDFSPSIILVDFYLAGELRGPELCRELKQLLPNAKLFGFSSVGKDPGITEAFISAGAIASIHKTRDAEWTLEKLTSWLIV